MRATFVALVCLLASACTDELTVSSSSCASGLKWNGASEESPEMNPGEDCVYCHTKKDGPAFAIAGTVFPAASEANDCYGSSGVTVEITDANGKVHSMTTNAAGNFFWRKTSGAIALPYKAAIVKGTTRIEMPDEQYDGSCNSCHTPTGIGGANGRITMTSTQ